MTFIGSNITKAGNLSTTYHQCDGSSVSSGSDITIEGTSSISGVSITNGDAVLSSGASYYLEISGTIYNYNSSGIVRWYNQTTSSYVGQQSIWRNSPASGTRVNRMVARCLILASDFGSNSTMTLSPRTTAKSGSALYELAGYTEPHVRIIRIT
jgi:hypothetical protein